MTISNDLMYAILAMDAYNRDYGAGIKSLGGKGAKIGKFTLGDDSDILRDENDNRLDEAVDFYAAAYSYNGQTVISYRGTDGISADFSDGYGIGLGHPEGEQAQLAAKFYQAVARDEDTGEAHLYDSGIKLTGHISDISKRLAV